MNASETNTELHGFKRSFISLELCANNTTINVDLLAKLKPKFCSIPWLNHFNKPINEIPEIILAENLCAKGYQVISHLAGRNLNQQDALDILNKLKHIGVKNILAIQGDATKGNDKRDFLYALDLVKFIKQKFGDYFRIAVAGYPDKFPGSDIYEIDIKCLKEKVDAGAEMIITQTCFQYEKLIEFHNRCRESSIQVPIIPGLFIINTPQRMHFLSKICKVHVPENIKTFISDNNEDCNLIKSFGLNMGMELITKIKQSGKFKGVHVFTFNDLEFIQKFYQTFKI